MKIIVPLLVGFCLFLPSTPVLSQNHLTPPCPTPPPPGASNCFATCIYCVLDGYSGTNNSFSGGNIICGQITQHNPVWHAFIANSSSVTLEITPSNCMNGDGLQAAIFAACDDSDALVCQPGGAGMGLAPIIIQANNLNNGSSYYLVIDGWVGDVCDYTIKVISGSGTPPVPSIATSPQGPDVVCPGAEVTYHIPQAPGAGYYHWTAPPGASINGSTNNEIIDAGQGESVSIRFGNVGGQVCVAAGNACYPETQAMCLNVTNTALPPTILPPDSIAFDEVPYFWPPNDIVLTSPGTYNLTAMLVSHHGCDSIVKQQIIILPANFGQVHGNVFWDTDADGTRDSGELLFLNGAVVKTSSGLFTNSLSNGSYLFFYVNQGDTVRVVPPLPGLTVTPPYRIKTGATNNYDFGLSPLPQGSDLVASISTSVLRPGFQFDITLVCQNISYAAVPSAVFKATLPLDQLEFIQVWPSGANVTINGNELTWSIGTMLPLSFKAITIVVKVPVGTPLGTQYQFDAAVTPVAQDANPVNNFDRRTGIVVGSYDPNDKQVIPPYVTPGMLQDGLPFEYTIRFQNTGTYMADFIRIVDSLGALVDPGTFRFISSSHPCTWSIDGRGIVEFYFSNIHLPDSNSNESASHGFVRFSVMPKKQIGLGTTIQNFCDIYFDFNPPIRTNTAGTQVVYFLPGEGLSIFDALLVRPNPAAFFIYCDWKLPAPQNGRIRLFDVTGLPRMSVPVAAGQNSVDINIQQLPAGLYYVVLEAGNLNLNNKVIIVKPGPLGN